jgi:carbamoyltransferase
MLFTAPVCEEKRIVKDSQTGKISEIEKERSLIPAVTHLDFSARVQTVNSETNVLYSKLLKAFYQATNIPVLVNTSFNIRGEPIVNSVEDAFNCFIFTDIDILVIGDYILHKKAQGVKKVDLKVEYGLDD